MIWAASGGAEQEACRTVLNQCRAVVVLFLCSALFILACIPSAASAQDQGEVQGEVQLSIASFGVGGLAVRGIGQGFRSSF